MSGNPYEIGLEKNPANHQPLTPLGFLERAASVFPDHTAIIHGGIKRTYSEFYARSRKLASVLAARGIGKGDTVSVMLPNIPEMLEAHYGVPMVKAVLHSMNTRLDPAVIAFQLDHCEAKVLITDREFSATVKQALSLCKINPLVIDVDDQAFPQDGELLGEMTYEAFIENGDEEFPWSWPDDEWDAITLNYTSGTTGNPKGVVYHHRGAALLAQGNALTASMPKHSTYLWTLPMFHCNGWCFPWTLSAIIGTHVCLRWVRGKAMWDALADHQVSHLCGAPVVMSTLLGTATEDKRDLDHTVEFFTAAAPPPERVLADMKSAGFNVTHLYGLTECYGPAVVNDWNQQWNNKEPAAQAALKARQGVRYLALEGISVVDPDTMIPVPRDGETIGEVMMRGNVVMKGYLKNPEATREAFKDGWFHTGDLGVIHEDGYIQLKDRSKDIIISGGENISSIEVEEVLYKHDCVSAAAVVAQPHERWGETPCAFIELAQGQSATSDDITQWCRKHLAGFKVPKSIVFEDLPKTSTGKIQKFMLRERAKELASDQDNHKDDATG